MKPFLILLPLFLLLSACEGYSPQIETKKYGNYIPFTENAYVELHKRIEIKPETARTYIQHGKITHGRDEYAVFCSFEIDKLSEKTQWVEPGTFPIERVQPAFTEIVQAYPIKVASSTLTAGMDYSPPMITRLFHFYLQSEQPNLMRMSCYGAFDLPADAYSPTLEEINQTLSGVAKLYP